MEVWEIFHTTFYLSRSRFKVNAPLPHVFQIPFPHDIYFLQILTYSFQVGDSCIQL